MMAPWSLAAARRRRLRQRRPAARHRVGLDPGRAGPLRAARHRVHPGRQARAGRHLGRDRRRRPRTAPGRARPRGGADRGAERAGRRRARARGGGDGRRPRAAARRCASRGTPIGLVSNSPLAFVDRSLELVGFEDHFDVVLSAHEVAAPKPAPDPYLEACRRLGVEPGPGRRRARGLADRRRRRARGRPDRDRHALDRGRRAGGGPPSGRVAARRRGRRRLAL